MAESGRFRSRRQAVLPAAVHIWNGRAPYSRPYKKLFGFSHTSQIDQNSTKIYENVDLQKLFFKMIDPFEDSFSATVEPLRCLLRKCSFTLYIKKVTSILVYNNMKSWTLIFPKLPNFQKFQYPFTSHYSRPFPAWMSGSQNFFRYN